MAKCYILPCLRCGRLREVTRRDAISCSSACRVWLHRHPWVLKEHRRLAREAGVSLFTFLKARAVLHYARNLAERLGAGELGLDEALALMIHRNGTVSVKGAKAT